MKKAKYTTGPWVWWDVNTGRPKEYDLMKLISRYGFSRQILSSYGGAGDKALGETKEDIANARLIAAAPDMYEALVQVELNLRQRALVPEDLVAIQSAIAKAEGKKK